MAKDQNEKNSCCCQDNHNKTWSGFLFGIGFALAIMASTIVVTVLTIGLYYLLKIFGINF